MAIIDFFFSLSTTINSGGTLPEEITMGSEDAHWGDESILMGDE